MAKKHRKQRKRTDKAVDNGDNSSASTRAVSVPAPLRSWTAQDIRRTAVVTRADVAAAVESRTPLMRALLVPTPLSD